MRNLINRFFAFANISYTMFAVRSNVKDGRKSPQIKPSAIFLSLILMVLFKKHSLRTLEITLINVIWGISVIGRDCLKLVGRYVEPAAGWFGNGLAARSTSLLAIAASDKPTNLRQSLIGNPESYLFLR